MFGTPLSFSQIIFTRYSRRFEVLHQNRTPDGRERDASSSFVDELPENVEERRALGRKVCRPPGGDARGVEAVQRTPRLGVAATDLLRDSKQ